jgi:hypothetical protein
MTGKKRILYAQSDYFIYQRTEIELNLCTTNPEEPK